MEWTEIAASIMLGALVTAAMASLIVESPLGRLLRIVFAGAPTEQAFDVWRENGADEATVPRARLQWLDDGMQCQRCVSSWVALLVAACMAGMSWPVGSFLVTWAGSWLLARLLLGFVRDLEERVGLQ